jgi:hypothetical protein
VRIALAGQIRSGLAPATCRSRMEAGRLATYGGVIVGITATLYGFCRKRSAAFEVQRAVPPNGSIGYATTLLLTREHKETRGTANATSGWQK